MLRYMNDRELAIAGIKSLRMVHFYHIVKDGDRIPAAMAYYDRDKIINLCMLDEHYDKLLEKIWEVYAEEKPAVIADEYSEQILRCAVDVEDNLYVNLTEGFSESKYPEYEHKGYMGEFVIPAVKYVIDELHALSGQKLMWNPLQKDWFGTGELTAMNGEIRIHMPYKIKCNREGYYEISVGNVLMLGNTLTIGLAFKQNGVDIQLRSNLYPIAGGIQYIASGKETVCVANVTLDGKPVYVGREAYSSDKSDIVGKTTTLINRIAPNGTCLVLPWGMKLLLESSSKDAGLIQENDNKIVYIASTDNYDYMLALSYKDIIHNGITEYSISDYVMDMVVDKRNDGQTQIHFCDGGYEARGTYKTDYEGRFYK